MPVLAMVVYLVAWNPTPPTNTKVHGLHQHTKCSMLAADESDEAVTPSTTTDWRVERARLTRQHSQAVLRRPRRFLPYSAASEWAQQLGLSTREEWDDWLELGEGWSSYVPRDPESHYTKLGQWLGAHRRTLPSPRPFSSHVACALGWRAWLTGEA